MASYLGIGADDPNHPLEVEGQVFISNVEQGSDTNYVPFEVYSDYSGIEGDILEGARQMRLRVTPTGLTTSNVNMDMGIEPTSGSYFYISNPVENATLGSNAAFRIVQAGHVEIGSNLSVSGNIVASNIIGGSPLTLSSDSNVNVTGSGGLTVTGPVNVGGTVSGTSATYSGQVQAATIRSTGVLTTGSNVGIGTTNPLSTLHVGNGTSPSSGDASGSISLSGTGSQKSQGTRPGIYHRANVGLGLWSDALMSFEVAGDATPLEAMRIVRSGNVGIGQASPGAKLDVVGKVIIHDGSTSAPDNGTTGSAGTRLVLWPGTGSSTPYALGIDASTLWYGTPTGSVHKWYVGTSEIMRIASNGNVGINNSDPLYTLDVNGYSRVGNELYIGRDTGDTTPKTIYFGGIDGDNAYNHAVIERRQYATGEKSELLMFSGNDIPGPSGPDRIRLRAGEICFDVYSAATTERTVENIRAKVTAGGIDVIGTLSATGATTLASLSAGTTSLGSMSAGATTLTSLSAGTTSLGSLNAGATTLTSLSAGATTLGSLNASSVYTQGNITINNNNPYFWLQDTNHDSAAIHCNSNNLYILRAPVNSTAAAAVGGQWPLTINLTNNDATFGRNIYAVNEIQAPYLRSDVRIYFPDRGSSTAWTEFALGVTGGTDTYKNYVDNYYTGFFGTNTRSRMRWDRNGAALMLLSYTGNLSISGGLSTNSDYRIKENIKSIDDDYAMSVVRSLDPKSFNWKDKEKDKGTEYGFLAQEVKALYPEMVSTSPGTIPMDQTSYPAQITSDTTMEITVSDGSTWTSGDKIAVNDNTDNRHTLTIHKIQNSVLSLTAETISSNMVDSNSETYIYGKEVDDFHAMKVSYLDPLMISALQQLDRRITALENR